MDDVGATGNRRRCPGVGACGGSTPPQLPQAIIDKGTPFGDLLVPKVQASVIDGAIGVPVESPVTVTADAGVLGQ